MKNRCLLYCEKDKENNKTLFVFICIVVCDMPVAWSPRDWFAPITTTSVEGERLEAEKIKDFVEGKDD